MADDKGKTLDEYQVAGGFDLRRFENESLEDFHDSWWTAPKLWALGIVTLGSALIVIYILSETMTRPL